MIAQNKIFGAIKCTIPKYILIHRNDVGVV